MKRHLQKFQYVSPRLARQLCGVTDQLIRVIGNIYSASASRRPVVREFPAQEVNCDICELKERLRKLIMCIPRGTILQLRDGTEAVLKRPDGFMLVLESDGIEFRVFVTQVDF